MSGGLANSEAVMIHVAIPAEVICSYFALGVVFVAGLVTIFVRGDWQKERGLDKLSHIYRLNSGSGDVLIPASTMAAAMM